MVQNGQRGGWSPNTRERKEIRLLKKEGRKGIGSQGLPGIGLKEGGREHVGHHKLRDCQSKGVKVLKNEYEGPPRRKKGKKGSSVWVAKGS